MTWDRGTADWCESRRAVLLFGVPCICYNIVKPEEPAAGPALDLPYGP